MMYNLIKQSNSGLKIKPFADEMVSNKLCFYHEIFFATRTRVSWKIEKSVTLSGVCPDWPVYAALLSDR